MADFYKCGKCGTVVKVVYKGEGTLTCCGEPMTKLAEFASVEEILDFAMEKEQEAHDFYHNLAGEVEKRWVKDLLEDFAREELGHKAKLKGVKDGRLLTPAPGKVPDLKISDYLVEVSPRPDMDSQDVLMVAMQREKAGTRSVRLAGAGLIQWQQCLEDSRNIIGQAHASRESIILGRELAQVQIAL